MEIGRPTTFFFLFFCCILRGEKETTTETTLYTCATSLEHLERHQHRTHGRQLSTKAHTTNNIAVSPPFSSPHSSSFVVSSSFFVDENDDDASMSPFQAETV